jgi:hypothetical protein
MDGICDQVMAALLHFPWSGGGKTLVHDIAIILSNQWLSDLHIDRTLTKIANYYYKCFGAEASSHHVFLPVMDLTSIVEGYKRKKNGGSAAVKRRQFLEVENNIVLSLALLKVLQGSYTFQTTGHLL